MPYYQGYTGAYILAAMKVLGKARRMALIKPFLELGRHHPELRRRRGHQGGLLGYTTLESSSESADMIVNRLQTSGAPAARSPRG